MSDTKQKGGMPLSNIELFLDNLDAFVQEIISVCKF